MQPEDEESLEDQGQADRSIKIGNVRVSRDMLILLGALAFLILAIALTFMFPVGQEEGEVVVTGTETATAVVTGTLTVTVSPYPGPTEQVTGVAALEQTQTAQAYPGPTQIAGIPTPAVPNGTLGPSGEEPYPVGSPLPGVTGATSVPTFDPARPTVTFPPPPTQPNGAGVFQPSPYPPPEDEEEDEEEPEEPTAEEEPTEADLEEEPEEPDEEPTGTPQPGVTLPTRTPAAPEATGEPVEPGEGVGPTPVGTPAVPVPTIVPADVLSGDVRWTAAQSPIILPRDVQLAPGSTLIIDAGVEVRLGPGVSFYVDGAKLFVLGAPGQPVRFVSDTFTRWEGLFGRPNSVIVLDHAEVQGGGAGGTLLTSERGSELVIKNSRISDNGGAILVTDSKLEVSETEISGNDMPYGAALDAVYTGGNFVTLKGNRVGGNRLSEGAPVVRVSSRSNLDVLNLDIQNNLFRDGTIGNLVLSTNGPLLGTVACNTLTGGNLGFSLRTQTPQIPGFQLNVVNNSIDNHTPPIIPVYLEFGIGRGAASEVVLDMRNNWWGHPSGPYDPEFNQLGRGDAVGDNIAYEPWLTAPPACVPPE